MSKQEEIIEVAGKRVRVAYCKPEEYACDKCCFSDGETCVGLVEGEEWPCEKFDLANAYFVPAEESGDEYCEQNCKGFQETGLCFADGECKAKKDADKAAEAAARREYPYEGGTKGAICEANIPIYQEGFIAGVEWRKAQMEERITLIQKSWYEQGKIDGKYEGLTDDEKYQQGAFDERERLMKEAVGCMFSFTDDKTPCLLVGVRCALRLNAKKGDYLEAIIIKKEK